MKREAFKLNPSSNEEALPRDGTSAEVYFTTTPPKPFDPEKTESAFLRDQTNDDENDQ